MRIKMHSALRRGWLWLYSSSWRRWARERLLVGLHVAYFVFFSILGCLSLWLSPKGEGSPPLSFIDALFSAVSAVTETGLSNVPMHRFTVCDQVTILLLMLVGGQVFTSAMALFLRRFHAPLMNHNNNNESPNIMIPLHDMNLKQELPRSPINNIRRVLSMPILDTKAHDHNTRHSIVGIISHAQDIEKWAIIINEGDHKVEAIKAEYNSDNLLMENKALVVMSWVTTGYFMVSLLLGYMVCHMSIIASPNARAVLKASRVNTGFFSLFAVVSALGNCGYIPLDDNLVPLQRETAMLLCLWVVILVGNTMYAPTIRGVIWGLYKLSPQGERKSTYTYMLMQKERSFTHLFPRGETSWLVSTVAAINAIQIVCMVGLDWKSEALRGLGASVHKLVADLFQVACTRAGGMNVVSLSGLSSATLFVALVAMYISSYPINPCEQERGPSRDAPTCLRESIFIKQLGKLKLQNIFLFLAILLVCFFERDSLKYDPINFSLFNIVFELISAYGNVGLSMGYDCKLRAPDMVSTTCTNIAYSFCGKWSVGGKMILIVVMFLGKHRGLPGDLDWNRSPPKYNLISLS